MGYKIEITKNSRKDEVDMKNSLSENVKIFFYLNSRSS